VFHCTLKREVGDVVKSLQQEDGEPQQLEGRIRYDHAKSLLTTVVALASICAALYTWYASLHARGSTYAVSVQVVDGVTDRPIPHATLSWPDGKEFTSDDGFAKFKVSSSRNSFPIHVFAAGFGSSVVGVSPSQSTQYKVAIFRDSSEPHALKDTDGKTTVISLGPVLSGEGRNYSGWYEVSAPSPPVGYVFDLEHSAYHLEGDRTCEQYSECKWGDRSPTKLSFRFRMQGHPELPPPGQGRSQGVINIAYKSDSFESMYTLEKFRQPMPRHWQRNDDGTWSEYYDNKKSNDFDATASVDNQGCQGLLLTKHLQPAGQVFVPSAACKQMLKYRWNGGSWQDMGPIERNFLHDTDQQGSPYSIEWQIDPACRKFSSSDGPRGTKLQCQLNHAGIHINGDNTPFDLWFFQVDAPGPITEIACRPTGSNEPTDHPEYNKTSISGNSANCAGLINGGDGDVIVSVKWRQPW
jgi:hypothetical protein